MVLKGFKQQNVTVFNLNLPCVDEVLGNMV